MANYITMSNCLLSFLFITNYVYTKESPIENFKAGLCEMFEDDILLTGLSYSECVCHCKTTPECAAVNFMQKMSLCRMNLRINDTRSCHGYVYSQKHDWEKETGCICSSDQRYSSQSAECNMSVKFENGKVLGNQLSKGKKVAYLCNPGYTLNGSRDRSCQANGTWSGVEPHCVEGTCDGQLVSQGDIPKDSPLATISHNCTTATSESSLHILCSDYYPLRWIRYVIVSEGRTICCWNADGFEAYLQINFGRLNLISGVTLKAYYHEFSRSRQDVIFFNVLYSQECETFTAVKDENKNNKTFAVTPDTNEFAFLELPDRELARCVRVRHTTWEDRLSLYFDVIGCVA